MGEVSLDQSHEAIAKLQTNIDWSVITPAQLQQAIRDPIVLGREATKFFQNGGRVDIKTVQIRGKDDIIVPVGGHIRIVRTSANPGRLWEDAVRAGAPQTDKNSPVWKVGNQYPMMLLKNHLPGVEIILVNFGVWSCGYEICEIAFSWGIKQHFRFATPQECFALLEQYPNLPRDVIGVKSRSITLISPVSCHPDKSGVKDGKRAEGGVRFPSFEYLCTIWCCGVKRSADLQRPERVFYDSSDPDPYAWVAFVRDKK